MYSVLIADDERWVILGIEKLIRKTGLPFEVVGRAENGIEALDLLMELMPDILITDIRMPGMDGLDLMEKMNACGIESRVVFISGYAEFAYIQRAMRMGAVDYLLKPIVEERFQEVLGGLKEKLDREREDDERRKLRPEGLWGIWEGARKETEEKQSDKPEEDRVCQCFTVQLRQGREAGSEYVLEEGPVRCLCLSREHDRTVAFAAYQAQIAEDEVISCVRRMFPDALAAGSSARAGGFSELAEIMEESNVALYTQLFGTGEGFRDYTGDREEGRKRLRTYMISLDQVVEEKNMNQLKILCNDMEKDMREGHLYIDQLALLYNQLAIRLNAKGGSFEYLCYQQIYEQFASMDRFFGYVRETIADYLGNAEDVTNSLLYSIVTRVRSEAAGEQTALSELSGEYGVSMGYLSSLLKKELGMPFSEYLTDKRIRRAKELLLDDRLSIEEIAEQVGYHDYFYFLKVFKKHEGISPGKYRKTLEGK